MTTKKRVLGVDPLNWIKQTGKKKNRGKTIKEYYKSEVPKFETYDVKLTLRINDKQLDFLTSLEREIMKKRSKKNKKERITKNSIVRAAIDILSEIEFKKSEIPNEDELKRRIFNSLNIT